MRVLYDITTLGSIHCAEGVQGAGIFRATEALGLALARTAEVDLYVSADRRGFGKALRYVRETGHFGPGRFAVPSQGPDGFATLATLDGPPTQDDLDQYLASIYSPERIYNPGRFDVYHVNWRGETALPVDVYPTIVATVFDVIALKRPDLFVPTRKESSIGEYLKTLLESVRAGHVVTVNAESVKSDVLELFPHISGEQVHVVPLGVSAAFHAYSSEDEIGAVRRRYGIPDERRYVLCVNTIEPRKNMATAIDAYRSLVRDTDLDDVSLVLAGSKGWLMDDLDDGSSTDEESIVVTGYVDEGDLAALYAGASLFCYPSLDEGFGLPVLEAMRCGLPVITSDRPPLRDLVGDAGRIVDPRAKGALVDAMHVLLTDDDLAAHLRREGLGRSELYTWDASATAMAEVYERAAGRSSAKGRGGHTVKPAGTSRTLRRPATEASLAELEGVHSGERCIVLGDGAELDGVPLAALEDEYTIAINAFHRHADQPAWKPTFYLITDGYARAGAANEVNALTGSLFLFEESARDLLRQHGDVVHFSTDDTGRVLGTKLFEDTPHPAVLGPDRALAAAIQIAQYMGFDVVLAAPSVDRSWYHGEASLSSSELRDWHIACRHACERAGTSIVNITAGCLPDTYRRADPYQLLAAPTLREFDRADHATLDETEVISRMLDRKIDWDRTMLDIGAHRGTSARHFVGKGWRIHCFEPDEDNRAHLEARLGQRDDVTIDPRAVGSQAATGVEFYSSPESTGISALSPFRDSHQLAGRVDVTTVADIVEEYGLVDIDFLKIDVEGHDLDVLRGVPWDWVKPAVIECEYEDAKTLPLGHSTADIVDFLRARGYTLYLSEWHPIIRYGIAHDWRRVVPVPGFDVPSNSWGNLLAFRDDPGYRAIQAAFAALVRTETREDASADTVAGSPVSRVAATDGGVVDSPDPELAEGSVDSPDPEPAEGSVDRVATGEQRSRAFYADTADRIRARAPGLYTLLRMVRRAGARLLRRRLLAALAFSVLVALVIAGFGAPSGGWRTAIWVGTGFGVLVAMIVLLGAYAYRTGLHQQTTARRLQELERQARLSRSAVDRRLAALERSAARLSKIPADLNDLKRDVSRIDTDVTKKGGRVETALTIGRTLGSRVDHLVADVRAIRRKADDAGELARHGTRVVRGEVDRIAARLGPETPPEPIDATTDVAPVLSIVVPAYGRPDALDECLGSVVDQVDAAGIDDVEVWVVDDRSPDVRVPQIAHEYASRHPYVGYRSNEHNLGLERNLLNSIAPSRGDYIWVLGADDVLHPGGLAMVRRDIGLVSHDVLLYQKTRIDRTGSRELPATVGSLPDIPAGESRDYDSLIALAAECGIISGLGFISTLVVRRMCLLGSSPEPYFGLTMYPQLGVLLETSAFAPARACNRPIVYHRTQTAPEKLAEAIGRREEGFMSGGDERDHRWFGASYAAMLQRAVDRSRLEVSDLIELPERLFGVANMVDWIRGNDEAARHSELILPEDVVADAARFFEAVDLARDSAGEAGSQSSLGR